MRLLVSGGGTAGHVYPALAMLAAWPEDPPDVLWVGSSQGMERDIVTEAGLAFRGVAAGALRGKALTTIGVSGGKLTAGFIQSLSAVRSFRPDVVLTTGGYVSVPVAVAARAARVPVVVFLPDVKPGLAVRAQQRFASRIAVAFDAACPYLPAARTVVTGYPLRPALLAASRAGSRAALGLDTHGPPVLLLYGGSRGARTLNDGLLARLPELLRHCRVVHVSGTLDHADVARRTAGLPGELAGRYQLHAYLGDRLIDALAAADLAVVRAGASTLAELPAVGLPAIVVPGPFSDQDLNAAYLAGKGAAVALPNEQVQRGALPGLVLDLLASDARRAAMATASRALARPDAAEALIAELRALAGA